LANLIEFCVCFRGDLRYAGGIGESAWEVMMKHYFANAPVEMRTDMRHAIEVAWSELGECGAWLTAAERRAVAAEARRAWECSLCQQRRDALSPYTIAGDHDRGSTIPDRWIDVIHRVVTDSGRLTESWLRDQLDDDDGLAEDEYVEIISVAIIATSIDVFCDAIGMTPAKLPAQADERLPVRTRRADAAPGPGWIATIAPADAAVDFVDFYDNDSHFYIRRALTLVPTEVRRFFDLFNILYMPDPRLHEFDGLERAIGRAQAEYLAARASARLGCYY
jgi:hypothetical protein